jgi:hypothetical protein
MKRFPSYVPLKVTVSLDHRLFALDSRQVPFPFLSFVSFPSSRFRILRMTLGLGDALPALLQTKAIDKLKGPYKSDVEDLLAV